VIALVRYVWADTLRSQRWVAPVLSFAAVDAILSAQTGSAFASYAAEATALLFVATWLTVVVVNNEDPVQQQITEACAGRSSTVRLSKLIVSFAIAVVLGVLGMIAPTLTTAQGTAGREIIAGVCAQFLTALMGVAFGAFCSRPIVPRRSYSVLLGVLLGLATVLIPHAPPTRQLLVLFNKTGQFALATPVALICVETIVLAGAAVAVSLRLSKHMH
jgi:hypothetical protein